MKDVPVTSLIVTSYTLKLAKQKGVVNSEWNGTYLEKDRLHAFIRLDHSLYINVHLATDQRKFPRWTYRIDFLKNATCKLAKPIYHCGCRFTNIRIRFFKSTTMHMKPVFVTL